MEATTVVKKRNMWVIVIPGLILVVLLLVAAVVFTALANSSSGKVLTQSLTESLGDATAAKFDFNTGTGNLTIDRLPSGESLLASGTLEYLESQDQPTKTVNKNNGLYILTLKANGGRQPGFYLPWAAYNGETDWQIYLNPNLPSDISVSSGGGNVKINLAGMVVTRLVTDTGGGNVDVVLPDSASDMSVTAKTGGGNVTVVVGSDITGSNTVIATSGAGNVVVRLPEEITACIHAATGMGKLIIAPQFVKIDGHTYQSPDYPSATAKIEITVESGAGDVSVITK